METHAPKAVFLQHASRDAKVARELEPAGDEPVEVVVDLAPLKGLHLKTPPAVLEPPPPGPPPTTSSP